MRNEKVNTRAFAFSFLLLLLTLSCSERDDPLRQYMAKYLPGWQVVDTSDYDAVWWSFYDGRQVPYHITTDINDDQLADHAVLMKRNNELKLVFFIGKEQGFEHVMADDVGGMASDIQTGLAIEPPAQIDVVLDQPKTLMLASNGFALLNLEQKLRVYYWKEGRMASFTMK